MPWDSHSVHQSAEAPTFGCNLRAIQNEGMAEGGGRNADTVGNIGDGDVRVREQRPRMVEAHFFIYAVASNAWNTARGGTPRNQEICKCHCAVLANRIALQQNDSRCNICAQTSLVGGG